MTVTKTKTLVHVPEGKGVEWWQGLSPDQKKAVVYPRLKIRDSNTGISKDMAITPNSIASMRNKWNAAKKQNPFELVWTTVKSPVKKKARAESQATEPTQVCNKTISADPIDVAPAVAPSEFSRRLAASERTQCGYSGRCHFERLPNSTSCGRPEHDK